MHKVVATSLGVEGSIGVAHRLSLIERYRAVYTPTPVETMKTLLVCRGPIAMETIELFRKNGWTAPHIIVSKKEWLAERSKRAPWARFMPPENIHYVEEYNDVPRVLRICKQQGIEAVYPGYGFLAENADFAHQILSEGVRWVGPLPQSLRQVGDKDKAIQLARRLGVPTIPSADALVAYAQTHTAHETLAEAVRLVQAFAAEHPKKPVRLKHPAGGGGKGQIVFSAADLARADADTIIANGLKKVWGEMGVTAPEKDADKGVVIELNLKKPLHWEVQLLGDGKTVVHLSARDCSIQNAGYQKMIEESLHVAEIDAEIKSLNPSRNKTRVAKLRQRKASLERVLAHAVEIGKAVGLRAACTVEFLIDAEGHEYFLEVNPRVQVEHGVTEGITRVRGERISIVEKQLRVAAGETLGFDQDDITFEGHTTEIRLNAWKEDLKPSLGGAIDQLRFESTNGLRVDASGLLQRRSRWTIPSYDANFALIIQDGATRQEVTAGLVEVLRHRMTLKGNEKLETNAATLIAMLTLISKMNGQTEYRTDFAPLWTKAIAVFLANSKEYRSQLPKASGGKEIVSPTQPAFYQRLLESLLDAALANPSLVFAFYFEKCFGIKAVSDMDLFVQLARYLKIDLYPEENELLTHIETLLDLETHGTELPEEARRITHMEIPLLQALWNRLMLTGIATFLKPNPDYALSLPAYLQSDALHVSLDQLLEKQLRPVTMVGDTLPAPQQGMVYLQSAPDQPPYIKVGDRVNVGTELFMMEAMKMFTPVLSPVEGTVTEILVENGAAVDQGSPLVRIETKTQATVNDADLLAQIQALTSSAN